MSLDYFPRLSAAISDNARMTVIVNRRFDLVGLVIAPLYNSVNAHCTLLIRVLTSGSLWPVVAACAVDGSRPVSQGYGLSVGLYILLPRGDKKLYFCLEGVFGCGVMLVANCLCYWAWGLVTGVAMVIVHTLMSLHITSSTTASTVIASTGPHCG